MKKRHLALTAAVALPMLAGVFATSPASASTVSPNTRPAACNAPQAEWVHVYHDDAPPICYGYTGIAYPASNSTIEVCAGNNSGSVTYYENGGTKNVPFWPGGILTFSPAVDVYSISITGWSGSWTC